MWLDKTEFDSISIEEIESKEHLAVSSRAAKESLVLLKNDGILPLNKDRIKIAFNPITSDPTKRFEVQDASHLKDKKWIPDIAEIFRPEFKQRAFENAYAETNEGVDLDELSETLTKLKGIANRQIGVIELDHSLDLD